MMGPDVERILSGIDAVKEAACQSVDSLASASAYQITTDALHNEIPVLLFPSTFVNPITSAAGSISGDCGNMNTLRGSLYTDSKSFNNRYGSPWTELDRLQDAVQSVESFAGSRVPMKWIGEKLALLGIINKVVSAAVDARWALMHFHDYIQRGFDHHFNNDIPSITFEDGKGTTTVGNIDHTYGGNVNIPKPPLDPY